MKNAKQKDFEMGGKPDGDALDLVQFCLKWLYADDEVSPFVNAVYQLTFEEIVGALRAAEIEIKECREIDKAQEEWDDRWEMDGKCSKCLRPYEPEEKA